MAIKNKKIAVCFGTRPEIIKLSPVIKELKLRGVPFFTVFTGQHKDLFDDVKDLVPDPDYVLNVMRDNQPCDITFSLTMQGLSDVWRKEQTDLVIIQGDTLTVAACALSAFYNRIKIGHVEAGLRTYDLQSPFPEEAHRQIVSRIADFNWAPTQKAVEQLKAENIKNVLLTGNTVIDLCHSFSSNLKYGKQVLITLHRRENFGKKMRDMFLQLENLAKTHPELKFIFPMHPNPNVQQFKGLFSKVKVTEPLPYFKMLKLLAETKFVISDSGGIQEECAAFNKKILVCRDTTERPEGVDAGFAKLIGSCISKNFDWANTDPAWSGVNPYGDGMASKRIIDSIQNIDVSLLSV